MAKIYRRTTLISGTKKKKDEKKRKRNIIMNFRVSPEEKQMIEEWRKANTLFKAVCIRKSAYWETSEPLMQSRNLYQS